jgi:hypothetical protein
MVRNPATPTAKSPTWRHDPAGPTGYQPARQLFGDLPILTEAITIKAAPPVVCCVCGSRERTRCEPGTTSTAKLYRDSNIVAFRSDDGVSSLAGCLEHDPLLRR